MAEKKVEQYWFRPESPIAWNEVILTCLFEKGSPIPTSIVWYRKQEGRERESVQVESSWSYNSTPDDVGFILEVELTWEDGSSECICTPEVCFPSVQHRRITEFAPHQKEDTIKVISYNVLAECLRIKSVNEPWFHTWEYRGKRLIDEMKEYKADIICLQEVWNHHYCSWFRPEFEKLGYEGVSKMKTNLNDGCAIFFLKERFKILGTHEIEFRSLGIEAANKFGSPKDQKEVRELLSKDNIALCLLFEKLDGSHEKFCVANTHMFRPNHSAIVSLFQIISFVQQVEKFAANFPFILCGDFNISPTSDAYQYVTEGKLELEKNDYYLRGGTRIRAFTDRQKEIVNHLKPLPRATSLVSAYANFNKSQPNDSRKKFKDTCEPWFTIKSHKDPNVFDYIFYSDDSINHCGVLELPDLKDDDVIPSFDWPSDHIALMGQFTFKAGV